jgi:hypothetical protein
MRPAEADFNMTADAFRGMNGAQMDDQDKRLRVHFSPFPQINQEKSAAEGRPIYDDVLYITIMVPGERDVVHRAAWQKDYDRFPLQFAAYNNRKDQDVHSGTPLKLLTWLTNAQVKELEFFNCYTVEQLASLADSAASKFMGIQSLKQRAKDFLVAAKEAAPLLTIRAEIEKKDEQLEAATNALKEQGARIKALEELISKQASK